MSYIGNKDYHLEIAKGNVADHLLVHISGFNSDVDAAEDVWPNGGDFVPPTTARVHNIASSDANDTSAGTGARTVSIVGADVNGDRLYEVVTMNGTSNVATANSYAMINDLTVETVGTGLVNAGIISATAQTDSTVTSTIPAGLGKSVQAIYQVPRGHVLHLDRWDVYAGTIVASSSECSAVLMAKPLDSGWNVISRLTTTANNQAAETRDFGSSVSLGGHTLIKVRITGVGSVDLDVTTNLTGVLVKGVIPIGDAILREDGLGYLLNENGGAILRE